MINVDNFWLNPYVKDEHLAVDPAKHNSSEQSWSEENTQRFCHPPWVFQLFSAKQLAQKWEKVQSMFFSLLVSLPAIMVDFGALAGALYQQRCCLRIPCPVEGQASAASAEPGAELPPA